MKHDEGVAVAERANETCTTIVMTICPPSYALCVGEEAHLPAKALEASREAYKARCLHAKRVVRQFPA